MRGVMLVFGKRLLGVVIACVLLQPVTLVGASSELFYSTDFDQYPTVAPVEWDFDRVEAYTSSENSVTPNSLKFGEVGSAATLRLRLGADRQPSQLAFWAKQDGASGSSQLVIEESNDGTTWRQVVQYDARVLNGQVYQNELQSTTEWLRFRYDKDIGNIAIDNVAIYGSSTIDTAPPTATIDPPSQYNPSAIVFRATDDIRLQSLEVTIETLTGEVKKICQKTSNLQADNIVCDLPVLTDGTYIVHAKAIDASSNETAAAARQFQIDTTAPSISIQLDGTRYNPSSITVLTDAAASNVRATLSSATLTRQLICVAIEGGAACEIPSGITDDTYTVRAAAHDEAGNWSAEATTEIILDAIAPGLTVGQLERQLDGRYIFSGTTDDGNIVQILLDGKLLGEASPTQAGMWSFETTFPIIAGDHEVAFVQTDNAGNRAQIRRTFFVITSGVGGIGSLPVRISPLKPVVAQSAASVTISTGVDTQPTSHGAAVIKPTPTGNDIVSPEESVALAPSTDGWKLWNIAWYWWLGMLTVCVVGLIGAYTLWHRRKV